MDEAQGSLREHKYGVLATQKLLPLLTTDNLRLQPQHSTSQTASQAPKSGYSLIHSNLNAQFRHCHFFPLTMANIMYPGDILSTMAAALDAAQADHYDMDLESLKPDTTPQPYLPLGQPLNSIIAVQPATLLGGSLAKNAPPPPREEHPENENPEGTDYNTAYEEPVIETEPEEPHREDSPQPLLDRLAEE